MKIHEILTPDQNRSKSVFPRTTLSILAAESWTNWILSLLSMVLINDIVYQTIVFLRIHYCYKTIYQVIESVQIHCIKTVTGKKYKFIS